VYTEKYAANRRSWFIKLVYSNIVWIIIIFHFWTFDETLPLKLIFYLLVYAIDLFLYISNETKISQERKKISYNLWQYRLHGKSCFNMHSVVIYHFLIHFSTLSHPLSPPVSMLAPRNQLTSDPTLNSTSFPGWTRLHWTGQTGSAIPFKLYEITTAVP
jgi:hypothetical protein